MWTVKDMFLSHASVQRGARYLSERGVCGAGAPEAVGGERMPREGPGQGTREACRKWRGGASALASRLGSSVSRVLLVLPARDAARRARARGERSCRAVRFVRSRVDQMLAAVMGTCAARGVRARGCQCQTGREPLRARRCAAEPGGSYGVWGWGRGAPRGFWSRLFGGRLCDSLSSGSHRASVAIQSAKLCKAEEARRGEAQRSTEVRWRRRSCRDTAARVPPWLHPGR